MLQFWLAVSFVVVVTFVHTLALPLLITYDGMEYAHLANVLSGPAVIAHWNFYRTPLFPLTLDLSFWLGGEQQQSALLVTTLFGVAGMLLVGFTVRKLAGGTAAAVALILLAFYPTLIAYEHTLLSETGIFFCFALLEWSLVCLVPGSNRFILLSCWTALVITLGYYWRPTILYFSPLVAVVFLLLVLGSSAIRPSERLRRLWSADPRVLASALIIAALPWLLAHPWQQLTEEHAPNTYEGFLAEGMFKEVLVPPDDPILASVRAEYQTAIEHDLRNGHLPLDGVTIGYHDALINRVIQALHAAGIRKQIVRYPVRYLVRIVKCTIFFMGVPDHRVDDENWWFAYYVFGLSPPGEALDKALGWDTKLIQFAPPPSGGAHLGTFVKALMPLYVWIVLASSIVSVGWLAFSIKMLDPVGLTLTSIPFALMVLHSLPLMAADRYAFPVYPLILANLVLITRSLILLLRKRSLLTPAPSLDSTRQVPHSFL